MKTNSSTTLQVNPNVHAALWAQFVAPVLDGTESHVRHFEIASPDDLASLFPIGSIRTDVAGPDDRMILASARTWTAIAMRSRGRDTTVMIRARDQEALLKAVALVRANSPVPDHESGLIEIDFWQVNHGAYTMERGIEAPAWDEIVDHYPPPVAERFTSLLGVEPTLDGGRLLLWFGPPGTGKTTAIRALARAWRDWARFQVVLDARSVLVNSANVMEVLLADDDHPAGGRPRWRVLVIEDADEFVRSDGREVGDALSRLLNIGDGIVGQGIRVLVLLTTNERVDRFHPALSRPGRCLSRIEFRRFTRAEARAWLGDDLLPGGEFSLAELLAGPEEREQSGDRARTGLYL